jgi:ribosome-binding protein aMBF1 (putative translation factor)
VRADVVEARLLAFSEERSPSRLRDMASDPDANARYVFRRIREIDAEGESLGERVKRLREERGLSQRDLEEPGLSYAYISRL